MNLLSKSFIALALVTATPVLAHHAGDIFRTGDIAVSHAWTEEASATSHAVEVFLTVTNEGDAADRLIAASTSFTAPGVFQAPVMGEDGTLSVSEVNAVELAPGQEVTFQPGGLRIVLSDVQSALNAGDHFHMTLEFAEAGELEIDVEIEARHDHDHDHAS